MDELDFWNEKQQQQQQQQDTQDWPVVNSFGLNVTATKIWINRIV